MGWWRNPDGDLIGDDSADVASEHLEALAARRKPALGELLAHLRLVLAAKGGDLLAPGEPAPGALVAEVENDVDDTVRIGECGDLDERLRDTIDAMCAAISSRYGAFVERRPSLREVLGSVVFVLAYRPDRYVQLPEDYSVKRIVSESIQRS